MYTELQLKKMPREQMLAAMREMGHPYTARLDASMPVEIVSIAPDHTVETPVAEHFDQLPFDFDGSTLPPEEHEVG